MTHCRRPGSVLPLADRQPARRADPHLPVQLGLRPARRRHVRVPGRRHRRRARLEQSYDDLLDALRWLGLNWDEGPEVGGPYAPYRQSERGAIYADVIGRLLAAGHLYEAFSNAEEIEARHKAAGRDPKLGYDNFDRNLTAEQIAAFRAAGRAPVLRLRMPDDDLTWNDVVRGEVAFEAARCRTSSWCAPTASRCTRWSTRSTTR